MKKLECDKCGRTLDYKDNQFVYDCHCGGSFEKVESGEDGDKYRGTDEVQGISDPATSEEVKTKEERGVEDLVQDFLSDVNKRLDIDGVRLYIYGDNLYHQVPGCTPSLNVAIEYKGENQALLCRTGRIDNMHIAYGDYEIDPDKKQKFREIMVEGFVEEIHLMIEQIEQN